MSKLLAILGVLVLVGAGCPSEPPQPTSREITPAPEEAQVMQEEPSSEEETAGSGGLQAKATIKAEGSTTDIDVGGGATLTTEASEEDEGVTDVVLGGSIAQTINMEATNYAFSPKTITAKAGDRIKVVFSKNSGFHTLVIDEIDLKTTIKQGENLTFTVPSKPGSYAFYCDVGNHRAMGMEGTLIVK